MRFSDSPLDECGCTFCEEIENYNLKLAGEILAEIRMPGSLTIILNLLPIFQLLENVNIFHIEVNTCWLLVL